jgi:hypothetical protein
MKFEFTKEQDILSKIEATKTLIKSLQDNLQKMEDNLAVLRATGAEEIIDSYIKVLKTTPEKSTYNITINTDHSDIISAQELVKKINVDYNQRKIEWGKFTIPNTPKIIGVTYSPNENGSKDVTLSWEYNDVKHIDGFMISCGVNEFDETSVVVESDKRNYTFTCVPLDFNKKFSIKAYREVNKGIDPSGILCSKVDKFI